VVTVHSLLDGLQGLHRAVAAAGSWRDLDVVWVGVGPRVADELRGLLGCDARVHVVPNAVEPELWAEHPAVPETHGRPEDPPAPRLVVAALRHTRRKRVTALPGILDVAAATLASTAAAGGGPAPGLRAVIAGEGPSTPALRRALRRRGMSSWVHLPGRVSQAELRSLYRRADVFVAPTVLESFGLAVLEARAAGLPVVARRESGSADVIADGVEGLLVADDVAAGHAVARLLADPVLHAAVAGHNRAVAPAFTWKRTLRLTESAYAVAASLTDHSDLADPSDDARPVPRHSPAGGRPAP
jgi:glycosyltransferase involved in cell wall biosynthesis